MEYRDTSLRTMIAERISILLIINESLIICDKINESQMKVYYLRKAADIGRLSLRYIYNILLVITSDCANTIPT